MADQNVNPYLSGADAAPQQSPYMAAPVGADNGASRFSLRLLMLISSVPSPLTAMMAANGIIAILLISKTRTLTAPGRRWAILSPDGWNSY
jgi:hypothetical protein